MLILSREEGTLQFGDACGDNDDFDDFDAFGDYDENDNEAPQGVDNGGGGRDVYGAQQPSP